MSTEHEIFWDGRTVWVNSAEDGSSIGRFSMFGVDVHRTTSEQLEGQGQCLGCSRDGSLDGWKSFCDLMLEHYGVEIPPEAMPSHLLP